MLGSPLGIDDGSFQAILLGPKLGTKLGDVDGINDRMLFDSPLGIYDGSLLGIILGSRLDFKLVLLAV